MADAIARKDAELRQYAEGLERRVEERTAELKGLLHAVPDLIFKISADGRLVDYVAAKDQELYLPSEQFLGQPISDVLPREVSTELVARIRRALDGEAGPALRVSSRAVRHRAALRGSPLPQRAGSRSSCWCATSPNGRRNEERTRFLSGAAASLSSSLDYGSTVDTLAALPVPFLADICVVDLLERGALRCGAVAARRRPDRRALVQATREKFPADAGRQPPGRRWPSAADPRSTRSARRRSSTGSSSRASTSRWRKPIGVRSMMVVPLMAARADARRDDLRQHRSARTATRRPTWHWRRSLPTVPGVALDNARLYRECRNRTA
jgi:hypothetical protein